MAREEEAVAKPQDDPRLRNCIARVRKVRNCVDVRGLKANPTVRTLPSLAEERLWAASIGSFVGATSGIDVHASARSWRSCRGGDCVGAAPGSSL